MGASPKGICLRVKPVGTVVYREFKGVCAMEDISIEFPRYFFIF